MRLTPILLSVLFVLIACTTSQKTVETKRTFTFDYAVKEAHKPGSANMLLGLVKPHYTSDFYTGSSELFRSFQDALGDDIEELVVAKGFALKGPYLSFDEMIFEDKKTTSILLDIEIAPRFTAQEGRWKAKLQLVGLERYTYSYSGKASLVGKINLSGVEPLTHQKIWSKSVEIPNIENIPIQTTGKYFKVLNDFELVNDPGVYNALGKALMTQYKGIMDKIAVHFNPEEFASLSPQIKELKSKKGY